MKPPKVRLLPPPAIPRTPWCPLCDGETVWDGDDRLICEPCGAWWPTSNYWAYEGNWAEPERPVCAAKIQPWKGSTAYPTLAKVIERCVLTAGHDPTTHRSADHDWTNDDVDGYRAERAAARGTEAVPLTS